MLALCVALLPLLVNCQTSVHPEPAVNRIIRGQLNSLPARIRLILDQNDYNGDRIIDANDIDIDLLRYQRDSDICCTSRAEWVAHQVALYGLTEEYVYNRYPSDTYGDCISTAKIKEVLGGEFQLSYSDFNQIQLDFLTAFCNSEPGLYTVNRDCQEYFDWALNPSSGECLSETTQTLSARETSCSQAANGFQAACNGVSTAGVLIPINVNDNNLPTLAQNCALLNNYLTTRL